MKENFRKTLLTLVETLVSIALLVFIFFLTERIGMQEDIIREQENMIERHLFHYYKEATPHDTIYLPQKDIRPSQKDTIAKNVFVNPWK